MVLKMPAKKQVISHVVAVLLGLLGGFFGKDLSALQKPAENAVTVVVDSAAEKATVVVGKKIEAVLTVETKAVDAGPETSTPMK